MASRLDNADKGTVLRERIDHPFTIAKSDWVEKFLPVFGLAGIELWELRFPQLFAPALLAREKEFLDRAVHDYDRGEYEDAFKDCRNLVQTLRKRSDELNLAGVVGKEEWKRANDYLSLALHEDAPPHKVVRADAEFAITLVWALFRRVAHSLDNPKATPEAPLVRLKDQPTP